MTPMVIFTTPAAVTFWTELTYKSLGCIVLYVIEVPSTIERNNHEVHRKHRYQDRDHPALLLVRMAHAALSRRGRNHNHVANRWLSSTPSAALHGGQMGIQYHMANRRNCKPGTSALARLVVLSSYRMGDTGHNGGSRTRHDSAAFVLDHSTLWFHFDHCSALQPQKGFGRQRQHEQ